MANKVVQLINEDNDNLYPLSGGVLSDSITTDMLKDDSVTSDKIDSTTLYEYTGTGHGESGNITLSAPFTDFKYIEVFAENLDGGQTSTKVLGNCDTGYLCVIDYYNNVFYLKAAQFRVSGTSLTWQHNDYQMRLLTNGTNAIDANAKWGILKIIGYN